MKESKRSTLLMKVNLFVTELDKDLRKQPKLMITVFSHLPVFISAEFFHINLSFFMSTFGILITYLVILMQFEMEYDESSPMNITALQNFTPL